MDEQFDEWEVYVSGGQPGSQDAARLMFVCISSPQQRPRFLRHASGDASEAEHELYHMDEAALMRTFEASEPLA